MKSILLIALLSSLVLEGRVRSRLGAPPVSIRSIVRTPRPSVTLAWTNPPALNLAFNRLYTGWAPRFYTNSRTLSLVETVSLTNVPPGIYYFAVTVADTNGFESSYSNEVAWTNAAPPPVTNFLLSVQILQSSDFTNWTTFTNLGQYQATNSGSPVYWRALMNIQPQ